MKKKVAVICGWFDNGWDYFSKISKLKLDFFNEVVAFEPTKDFNIENQMERFNDKEKDKITLYHKAVWIHNKGITFYDLQSGENTVFSEKLTGPLQTATPVSKKSSLSYPVDSVDLTKFLKKYPKEKWSIYIQMNIEGAEWPILKKMFDDNIFKQLDIRQLYLDNHVYVEEENRVDHYLNLMNENNQKLIDLGYSKSQRPQSGSPHDFLYTKK